MLKIFKKTPPEPQFITHYHEWRARRLAAILDHYGSNYFFGKSLLEVGCGHCDIGNVFFQLGSDVTCVDVRKQHLAVARRKYPHLRTKVINLEDKWSLGKFDIILHMGVLYHLADFRQPLIEAAQYCTDLVLETEVCDSSSPDCVISVAESGYDQAVSGCGVRPSAKAVENALEVHHEFVRIDDSKLNAGFHNYDWKVTDSGKWRHGLRRFWFCKNKRESNKN